MYYFANKGPSSQGYGFSSGHVWMWELVCEESWVLKKWRRLLRVPWTARRSNHSILKEISPGCSLGGLMLKLKLQYFLSHLFLLRKANLDSILKGRNIALPTKVHIVKSMVFPVVMYGCESWFIKKADCQRVDAFKLCCCWRLLRVPWTARRSN